MKYDVHIYAIVRVSVPGIEADSPRQAAILAENRTDLNVEFRNGEYAEDIDCFLVDELDSDGNVVKTAPLDKDFAV